MPNVLLSRRSCPAPCTLTVQFRPRSHRPVEAKEDTPEVGALDQSFRDFRAKLMADGWWDRDAVSEAQVLLPILGMITFGTIYATEFPLLSTLLIGVAM